MAFPAANSFTFFFFSIESPSKFSTVLVQNTTEAYLVDFTKQGYLVAYVLEDGWARCGSVHM